MFASYRLFVWYTTFEFYRMPKLVPSLYFLGVAPFSSGFLLILLDTIGLPAKHIFFCCLLLHNQPSLGQQLVFQADHEHFYFFKRQSMFLWWYASWAWIHRRMVWDCLNSQYWLLHSGQSCLVGNFKLSFQQCLKKGQFQCNLACLLSYLSSFS